MVDISLVAVMGGLCVANGDTNALGLGSRLQALGGAARAHRRFKLHDAVDQAVVPLLPGFPYLNTPIAGAGIGASTQRSAANRR